MISISENIQFFEKTFDLINKKFFENMLEKPVITIQSSPKAYGHCTSRKVWIENTESYYEINIGAETLNRPVQNIIATLIHEMVHLYCQQNNIQETSRGGTYHNKRFKTEAERRGLSIDFDKKVGWSITKPTETIMQFVEENKLHKVITCYRVEVKPEKKKTSSTKKYTCPQCGSVVRATKTVHILCADCKMLMECDD